MQPKTAARQRQVGINAHLLSGLSGYRRAGIHHYIAELINALPQAEAWRYLVFTNAASDLRSGPAMSLKPVAWPTHRRLARILWEQTAWPLAAARLDLDLLHSPAFVTPLASPCPTIVTVHDLSFIHYPGQFPRLQQRYLATQTRRSCRRARRIAAVSESTRQDVHQHFHVPLERIDVVPNGVGPMFAPRPPAEVAAFRRRQGLAEPFVLHVGTLQPRKNIPMLIDAFALLDRPELELVLVGGKGWSYGEIFARIEALGLQDRVRFAGYVPDADLPLWYNAAALLAFASSYEGFGLPLLQAMACGTPVIAADTSSVPEVAGSAARTFAVDDVTALAEHMAAVLDDPAVAATMRAEGRERARRYTWAETGRKMLAVYRRALD